MDKPLAFRMAPETLKDVLGQKHLIGEGKILSNMVKNKKIFSMILYGEPGIGKTSIAKALMQDLGLPYRFLNATINNKKDLDIIIEEAKMYDGLILIIDEIHRLNKDKQDILLPVLESGLITLIGLTTANPYHRINQAIRSRCQVFKLEQLTKEDILEGLKRACNHDLKDIKITDEALVEIASKAKFDLRFAYNLLEVAYYFNEEHQVTKEIVNEINNTPVILQDKDEDGYYNSLSGLQKSIRGSDVDAALHYLARLLASGDLDSIARRLAVIAYEDIGLANPNIALKVKTAIDLAFLVGLPEAELIFAPVVIEMALSPKSNSAYLALNKACEDLKKTNTLEYPSCIKSPYIGYLYPHQYKNAIVKQTYLPKNLEGHQYYFPKTTSKYEEALKTRKETIEKLKQEIK